MVCENTSHWMFSVTQLFSFCWNASAPPTTDDLLVKPGRAWINHRGPRTRADLTGVLSWIVCFWGCEQSVAHVGESALITRGPWTVSTPLPESIPLLSLIGCLVGHRCCALALVFFLLFYPFVHVFMWWMGLGLLQGCWYWTRSACGDWLIPWSKCGSH